MKKNDYNKIPNIKKNDILKFINGEDYNDKDIKSNEDKTVSWDSARADVHKYINVRISEEYFMKLDYLSKKHRLSKNKICSEAVIAEIHRMLAE